MRTFILAAILVMSSGCNTTPYETAETARKHGFTKIKPGDLDWWVCGENDKTGRTFSAINPQGDIVSGVVCCGTFKGCTVRF